LYPVTGDVDFALPAGSERVFASGSAETVNFVNPVRNDIACPQQTPDD